MRIALASHAAEPGGAEIAMLDMAAALNTQGVSVLLVLLSDGPLVADAQARGIPVDVVPLGRPALATRRHSVLSGGFRAGGSALLASRSVARVLRRNRIDLLETNSLKAHLVGAVAARRANVPCIWRLRDIAAPPHLSAHETTIVQWASRLADRVLAVSQVAASSLRHPRMSVEPSAIRVDRFADIQALQRDTPRALRVACISRLAYWKGQDILQDALHLLEQEGFPVEAVFAGEPLFGETQFRDDLYSRATPAMSFVGHVAEVRDILRDAHVVVHTPRLPEPFGKVIVEGMAAGRVVIAPDEAGPAEILKSEFSNWLVPKSEPRLIANKLRDVSASWEGYAKDAVRARLAASRYDVAQSADRLITIYRSTLSRNGR
jgi:glycosyltransferase involved in cell wall biosynthesis